MTACPALMNATMEGLISLSFSMFDFSISPDCLITRSGSSVYYKISTTYRTMALALMSGNVLDDTRYPMFVETGMIMCVTDNLRVQVPDDVAISKIGTPKITRANCV
jgi:hypothetical protein